MSEDTETTGMTAEVEASAMSTCESTHCVSHANSAASSHRRFKSTTLRQCRDQTTRAACNGTTCGQCACRATRKQGRQEAMVGGSAESGDDKNLVSSKMQH